MIISTHPLPLRKMLNLRIKLPDAEECPKAFMSIQVETRWTAPDANLDLHCVGCLFVNIDAEDQALVQKVEKLLSFEG